VTPVKAACGASSADSRPGSRLTQRYTQVLTTPDAAPQSCAAGSSHTRQVSRTSGGGIEGGESPRGSFERVSDSSESWGSDGFRTSDPEENALYHSSLRKADSSNFRWALGDGKQNSGPAELRVALGRRTEVVAVW